MVGRKLSDPCRRVADLGENTNQFENNCLNLQAFRIWVEDGWNFFFVTEEWS